MRPSIIYTVIAAGSTFASPFAPPSLSSKHKHAGVLEARAVLTPSVEEEPLIPRHQHAIVKRQSNFGNGPVISNGGNTLFDQIQANAEDSGNSGDTVDYSLQTTGGDEADGTTTGTGAQPLGNPLATRPGSKLAAEVSTNNLTDVSTNTGGNNDGLTTGNDGGTTGGTGGTTGSIGGTTGGTGNTTGGTTAQDTTTSSNTGGCAHEQGIPQSFCPSNTPAIQRLKSRHLKSPRQQPSSSPSPSSSSSGNSPSYLPTLNTYRSKFCLPPLTHSPALEANAAYQGTVSHGSVRSMTESPCPGQAQVMAGGSPQDFDLAMRIWVCEVSTSNVDYQGCVDAWCEYGFVWTERGHFDLLVGRESGRYTSVGCAFTGLEGGRGEGLAGAITGLWTCTLGTVGGGECRG